MLNIYANSMMTATRLGHTKVRDVAPQPASAKKSWLPKGHWWTRNSRYIDLNEL